jgi:hypothetical protein
MQYHSSFIEDLDFMAHKANLKIDPDVPSLLEYTNNVNLAFINTYLLSEYSEPWQCLAGLN